MNIEKSHRNVDPEDFGSDQVDPKEPENVENPNKHAPAPSFRVRLGILYKKFLKEAKQRAVDFASKRFSGLDLKAIRDKGFINWLKETQSSTITGIIIAAAAVVGYDPDAQTIDGISAFLITAAGLYDIIRHEEKKNNG